MIHKSCYLIIVCLAAAVFAGCTPSQYAAWADRDAYWTIGSGQSSALGNETDFNIAYRPIDALTYLPGENDKIPMLKLQQALEIAFRNSRGYQTQKEKLFASALTLANLSRPWDGVLPGGDIDAEGNWIRSRRDGSEGGTDRTAKDISAGSSASLTRRLVGGGLLTLGASMDFATDFLGISDTTIGSSLSANFTQPLLRGAWRDLAYEDQYRLKRDFLFDVFSFSRFRQTFATDIVKKYYNVLSLRNIVENDLRNIERLKETFAMTRTLVNGGQVSRIQQDQAEQNLLSAQVRLEAARQTYYSALDRFKITLGLPISTKLVLDYPEALDELQRIGTKPLPFNEKQAVQTALSTRTNLLTARASVRDADKEVEIAADNFLPRLDLELGVAADAPGHKGPLRVQNHRHTRTARLIFDYQLDQTDNRDAYRNAMITLNRSKRDLDESEDNVQLDVIDSFRSLQRSQASYGLQQKSVAIAKRRTKLAALQQEQGQASTRDVLEAEEALRDAMNGLVNSLIGYTTTRLDFLAELGMIDVDSKGNITEQKKPFGFDRLQQHYPYLGMGKTISEGRK